MALAVVCSCDMETRLPNPVDAALSMAAGILVGCVGSRGSGCRVQSCCDMLPRGAETRRGRERKRVKKGRRLGEDDAGEGDRGHTWEIGIDTCRRIRLQLALGNEKVD